jgi:hypothetical protein
MEPQEDFRCGLPDSSASQVTLVWGLRQQAVELDCSRVALLLQIVVHCRQAPPAWPGGRNCYWLTLAEKMAPLPGLLRVQALLQLELPSPVLPSAPRPARSRAGVPG